MPKKLELTALQRHIVHNGQTLADINPELSVEEIVRHHARTTPSLLNANIEGPVIKDGLATYTINTKVGVKG